MTSLLTDPLKARRALDAAGVWLFDLDGTLVDSLPLLVSVYRDFVTSVGGVPTEEEFEFLNGYTIPGVVDYVLSRLDREDDRQSMVDVYETMLKEQFYKQGSLAVLGAEEILLQGHQSGKKMGLVTSSKKYWVELQVEQRGWKRFFNAVIAGDQTQNVKPHPDPYLKAVDIFGVMGKSAVALEDSTHGITSAQSAGLSVIKVAPPTGGMPGNEGVSLRALVQEFA